LLLLLRVYDIDTSVCVYC